MNNRNEIPFSNSNSKCLIENWMEERTTKNIDGETESDRLKQCKFGHPQILTAKSLPMPNSVTQSDFTKKDSQERPNLGIKGKAEQEELYKEIYSEVDNEFNPPNQPLDYQSVTSKDFFSQKVPDKTFENHKKPTVLAREQPITFWTDHVDRMHGMSQIKTLDTPFRKNAAFSTPVECHWNSTRPYQLESYPKM